VWQNFNASCAFIVLLPKSILKSAPRQRAEMLLREYTGLAFDSSLGYCFYRSQYILLNIVIGFKALSLPDGVTNFYLKNGIELGVAF